MDSRRSLGSASFAWERGRPARRSPLIAAPVADETSALPGLLSPVIDEMRYLVSEAAEGQFPQHFALLRGPPWDLLESLHVPTALSPSQSHAVALAGCIRRRARPHLFHGAEFKERD